MLRTLTFDVINAMGVRNAVGPLHVRSLIGPIDNKHDGLVPVTPMTVEG